MPFSNLKFFHCKLEITLENICFLLSRAASVKLFPIETKSNSQVNNPLSSLQTLSSDRVDVSVCDLVDLVICVLMEVSSMLAMACVIQSKNSLVIPSGSEAIPLGQRHKG